MNANELADELKYITKVLNMNTDVDTKPLVEAAAMLRQQQADLKDADKYALELERLYEDAKAEIEALKANRKHDFGLGEASGFIKGHKENPYKAITNTKIEPTVVSYTHPVKAQEDAMWVEAYQEGFEAGKAYLIQELRKAQEK